jgi:ABC-type multidrug transport system fused ATPase/permease subunit
MVYFFVLGVQFLAELKVSLKRIDDFLSMPEPPPPTHQRHKDLAAYPPALAGPNGSASSGAPALPPAAASAAGAGSGSSLKGSLEMARQASGEALRRSMDVLFGRSRPQSRLSDTQARGSMLEEAEAAAVPVGGLKLGGADYDWSHNVEQLGLLPRSSGGSNGSSSSSSSDGGEAIGEEAEEGEGGGRVVVRPRRCTLEGVVLSVAPGELLGICGEVGAGKSSVLAALLGELQPVRGADGLVKCEGGPL